MMSGWAWGIEGIGIGLLFGYLIRSAMCTCGGGNITGRNLDKAIKLSRLLRVILHNAKSQKELVYLWDFGTEMRYVSMHKLKLNLDKMQEKVEEQNQKARKCRQ